MPSSLNPLKLVRAINSDTKVYHKGKFDSTSAIEGKVELPNSGHFRFEIVFFLEAAFSAAVFILSVC